jgi:hypothetical protein
MILLFCGRQKNRNSHSSCIFIPFNIVLLTSDLDHFCLRLIGCERHEGLQNGWPPQMAAEKTTKRGANKKKIKENKT